jgi:hypothetical protein
MWKYDKFSKGNDWINIKIIARSAAGSCGLLSGVPGKLLKNLCSAEQRFFLRYLTDVVRMVNHRWVRLFHSALLLYFLPVLRQRRYSHPAEV